jgi:hypothetical protein
VGKWSRKDSLGALSFGLEIVGFWLAFGATSLAYRLLGWGLVALGIVPWAMPAIRTAIAEERRRDGRS